MSGVAVAVLLAGSPTLAEDRGAEPRCGEAIVPDRPGATNGYAAVKPGCFQLETSTEISSGADASLQSFPTALRLGVAEHLEVRLESPVLDLAYAPGGASAQASRSDVALGVKYTLAEPDGGARPGLGFTLVGVLPGAAQTVSQVSPRLDVLADWQLPAGWGLSVNAGVEYASAFTSARSVNIPLAAVLGFTVPGTEERLGLFIDSAAAYAPSEGAWSQSVGGGLAFRVAPTIQLDLSGSANVTGGESPWWTALGVSWMAPLF
jgi:hypothetical protein